MLCMLLLLSATTCRGLVPRVAARVRGSVRFAASADDEWALPPGWARALAGEVGSPRFAALKAFVAAERAAGTVYPPPEQTLAALRAVDVDDVRCVATLGAGGSFGELGLIMNQPRAATIDALEDCVAWRMDSKCFHHFLA